MSGFWVLSESRENKLGNDSKAFLVALIDEKIYKPLY